MTRPAPSALVLRSLVVVSPLSAVGVTWLAAGRARPEVAVLVALLAMASAARPNGHLGLLVVAAVTVQWIAMVDDHATPWSVGCASALMVFHASLAAATVAPPTAAWTPAMARRWCRRAAVLALAGSVTWVLVAIAKSLRPAGTTAVLVAALLVLSVGAVWASSGARAES